MYLKHYLEIYYTYLFDDIVNKNEEKLKLITLSIPRKHFSLCAFNQNCISNVKVGTYNVF